MTDIDYDQAERVIQRIAELAQVMGEQAGVGGMETAGHIVSYLADHPHDIAPCLRFGLGELPLDWIERGSLTWHARDGKVVHPQHVRRARTIRKLMDGAP